MSWCFSNRPVVARATDCSRRRPVIQQSADSSRRRSGSTLRSVQQKSGLVVHSSGPMCRAWSSTVSAGSSGSIRRPQKVSRRDFSATVSGKSSPVSRVKTGKGSPALRARWMATSPAPWKLVPIAALSPKASHAQRNRSVAESAVRSVSAREGSRKRMVQTGDRNAETGEGRNSRIGWLVGGRWMRGGLIFRAARPSGLRSPHSAFRFPPSGGRSSSARRAR